MNTTQQQQPAAEAFVPDMREWYMAWPDDIRKKISLRDLQRMWKCLPAAVPTVAGHTARPLAERRRINDPAPH